MMSKKSFDSDILSYSLSKIENASVYREGTSKRLIDVNFNKNNDRLVFKVSKSIENNTVLKEISSIEKKSWNSITNNKTSDSELLVFPRKKNKSDNRNRPCTTRVHYRQSNDCEHKSTCKKSIVCNRYKKTYDPLYYMMTEEDVEDTFPVSHFKFPLPTSREKNNANYCCLDFDGTRWEKKKTLKINEEIENVKIVNKSASLSIHSRTVRNEGRKDDKMQIILSPKKHDMKNGDNKHRKNRKHCKIILTSSTLNVEGIKPLMKNQEQQTEISFTLLKNIMKSADIQKIRRRDVEALFKKQLDKEKFKKLVEHPTDLSILCNLIEMKNIQKKLQTDNNPGKNENKSCKKKVNLSKVCFPIVEINSSQIDDELEAKQEKTPRSLPRRRIGEQELLELFENAKKQNLQETTTVINKQSRPQMPRKTISKKKDVDNLIEDKNENTYKNNSDSNNDENYSNLINNSGTSLNDYVGSDVTMNSFNRDICKWLLQTEFGKSLEHDMKWTNLTEKNENKSTKFTIHNDTIENLKLELSNLSEKIIQEFLDSKFNENRELHQELLNLNKIIAQFKAKINKEEILKEIDNDSINNQGNSTSEEEKENDCDTKIINDNDFENIHRENTFIINNCIHPDYSALLVTKEVNSNCFEYLNAVKRTFKENFKNENTDGCKLTQINDDADYVTYDDSKQLANNLDPCQKQLIENITNTLKYNNTKQTISEAETDNLISNQCLNEIKNISNSNEPYEIISKPTTIDTIININNYNPINTNLIDDEIKEINPSIQRSNTFPALPNGIVYKSINLTKTSKLPILKKQYNPNIESDKSIYENSIITSYPVKGKSSPGSIHNSTFLFTKVNKDQNKDSSFKKRKEYYQKIKQHANDIQKQEKFSNGYRNIHIGEKWKRNPEFCVNVCFTKYTNFFQNTKCKRFKKCNEQKWWNDINVNPEYGAGSAVSLESGIGSLHASTIVSNQPFQPEDFEIKNVLDNDISLKTESNNGIKCSDEADKKQSDETTQDLEECEDCSLESNSEVSLCDSNFKSEDACDNPVFNLSTNTIIVQSIDKNESIECDCNDTKSNPDLCNSDSESVIRGNNSKTQSFNDLKDNHNNKESCNIEINKMEQDSCTESTRDNSRCSLQDNKTYISDYNNEDNHNNDCGDFTSRDDYYNNYFECENDGVQQNKNYHSQSFDDLEITTTRSNNECFDTKSFESLEAIFMQNDNKCSKNNSESNLSMNACHDHKIITTQQHNERRFDYPKAIPVRFCKYNRKINLSQIKKNFQSLNNFEPTTVHHNNKYCKYNKRKFFTQKHKSFQTFISPGIIRVQRLKNISQQNKKSQSCGDSNITKRHNVYDAKIITMKNETKCNPKINLTENKCSTGISAVQGKDVIPFMDGLAVDLSTQCDDKNKKNKKCSKKYRVWCSISNFISKSTFNKKKSKKTEDLNLNIQ